MNVKDLINSLESFPDNYIVKTVVAVNGEGYYTSIEPISKNNIEIREQEVIIYCE
ncbi:hypothetical protein [Enterococcus villorum]|uniref:Uncharacterized protein n=1 Tax=Enterococcus villorum TaxID=112904 RepID=A0A511J6I3_9ENTE|nr:hypothetical protein [Enterococcus villorum]GEL93289.1 hypothetical protein EVI01_26260 [Enterococcus villorum]